MDLRELQAYAYFFYTAFLVFILYAYIIYLYRAEKKGTRNFEKYGNMALSDEIGTTPIESVEPKASESNKEKKETK
jgi:cytochrome c oxidase cbb3-type subunit 4